MSVNKYHVVAVLGCLMVTCIPSQGQMPRKEVAEDNNPSDGKVSMPCNNTERRVRELVRQFLKSGPNAELEELRRLTEIPFRLLDGKVVRTRKELEEHVKKEQQQKFKVIKYRFISGEILTLPEYLKKAKPEEKRFLAQYPSGQVRVVLATMEIISMGQIEFTFTFGNYVHVGARQVRVFGMGLLDVE
jgi:hypothetical protein